MPPRSAAGDRPPSCPVCDAAAREWRAFGAGFVRCPACDLLFRHPMPRDDQLDNLYHHSYSHENIADGTTGLASPTSALLRQADFVSALIAPGSRILDFGAGTGELAGALQERGFNVVGVDSSESAIAAARARFNVPFFVDLERVAADEDRKFDLVIAIEVIEHLKRPMRILRQLNGLLRNGGQLYLTTPNSHGLLARLAGRDWREAQDPCHLALYNYGALKRLLEKAEFSHIRYIRYSPLTESSPARTVLHRSLQVLGLYGGLRVMAVA